MTTDFDFGFQAPGWGAKEKDLSTPAVESPGLTPVILVGEFPQGPAFTGINHRNIKAFNNVMGVRSNERLGGAPRYMASFHATSILEESNDLTTVRVLGLSGYTAGPSWVITTDTGSVLARLRARGLYTIPTNPAPTFAVTSVTATQVDDTPLGGGVDYLTPIKLTLTGPNGTETYQVSFNQDSPDYLPLVLGTSAHDRTSKVFVESIFPDTTRKLFETGVASYINAVSPVTGHTNFLSIYQEASTPWVVSQRQGSSTSQLLRFITIGDGEAANREVKVTFENIDLATATFDVIIRDFNDTDDSPLVLERFSGLNMNPDSKQYVLARMGGRVEGNTQNSYPLVSTKVITEVKENAPVGTVPCGFEGYYQYSGYAPGVAPAPVFYKTTLTSLDKPGKFSFGVSERAYDATARGRGLDPNLYQFSGVPVNGTYTQSLGFHLDAAAANLTTPAGKLRFSVGPDELSLPVHQSDPDSAYYNKRNRRFTVALSGGFDGWDIYRTERTNKDAFRLMPRSDYQAWLNAITLLENPLDTPGEILITSGLNFSDHLALVEATFEVVHEVRKDCVYLVEAPDLGGEPGTTQDVCDLFAQTGLQSSYGAWHTPWVQDINTDAGGSVVYVSPTGKQARAMALTDKQKAKWFAAAGVNRGAMTDVRYARRKLSDRERVAVNLARGNAIVTHPHGLVDIFGNNTMLPVQTGSPLTSLNVRRALLYIRKELGAIAESMILDQQSDDVAAQSFLSQATPILDRMKRERGLFSFEIGQVEPDTPEAADRKRKYFRIAVKPIEALENIGFIIEVGEGAINIAEA
jgi:hypothetical protein